MRIWKVEVSYHWNDNENWTESESWTVNADNIEEAIKKGLQAEKDNWEKEAPKYYEVQKAELLTEVDVE